MRPPKRGPRLQKLVLAMEVLVFVIGTYVTVSSMRSGVPLSRPGLIALVAGAVGILATLVGTGVRARRERVSRG